MTAKWRKTRGAGLVERSIPRGNRMRKCVGEAFGEIGYRDGAISH
jgi:hypothetical protein